MLQVESRLCDGSCKSADSFVIGVVVMQLSGGYVTGVKCMQLSYILMTAQAGGTLG